MKKINKKPTPRAKKLTSRTIQRKASRMLKSIPAYIIKEIGVEVARKALMVAIATFGVAGTGTAISNLSGAAATNAVLAYLGFGSVLIGEFIVLPLLAIAVIWLVEQLIAEFWEVPARA